MWRYPLLGFAMLIAATAGFVALERDSVMQEESVVTAEPTPRPSPTPEAAPAEPSPTVESAAEPTEMVAQGTAAQGEALANTEAAPSPLADASYVPSFVATGDRTQYDADVSVPLSQPTARPSAAAVAAPTATPAPTPPPAPEPTETPKQEKDNDGEGDGDAADTSDGDDGADDDSGAEGSNGGGPTADQWAALRRCESGGSYTIVSPGGAYRGAYQFSQATWDSTAASADPSLVGVDPIDASPAQQDALAFALYAMRGASPWPSCGRHLR